MNLPFSPKAGRKLLLSGAVLACLAACADDPPPVVQNFIPLHYDYLSKLRLNVGTIDVQDHAVPLGPRDVAATAPAVPAQALQQMAHDRLFAAGLAGQGAFVIDQASILREPDGTLDGHLAVHLDLIGPSGTRAGFAEAQVSRRHIPGSEPEADAASLYTLTRQMMDDMNVELEFQIKRSLSTYLVAPGSAPAPVAAEPLATPGAPPPTAPPPLPPAETGEASPDPYQDQAAPQQMSPAPGFLQPPPGS